MCDQVRRRGQDVAGGTVVALEPNDLGAWKVVLEAQDVVDLRAAPAIDRLVVVADAADVFGGCHRCRLRDASSFVIPGRTGRWEPGIHNRALAFIISIGGTGQPLRGFRNDGG